MGRPVGDPTITSGKSGDAMANNTTQHTGTYDTHNNGPRKYEMATTRNKCGRKPGAGRIYGPPDATTQQPKPSELRTDTQNIVEPLTFGTRGL